MHTSFALRTMTSSELFKQQEPVLLEAYGHQVGGHSLLLRYGDALCKPLLPREHFYYETIPHELKAFTPRYNGERRARLASCAQG